VHGGREINFRVSGAADRIGEKVVLSPPANSDLQYDIAKLGMDENSLKVSARRSPKPSGMMLVTGRRKRQDDDALFALRRLTSKERNISSAGRPRRDLHARINQVKIQEDIGLTFAAVLRSLLPPGSRRVIGRRDPRLRDDRDRGQGRADGHLVLSTLHTNDAPSTIRRMLTWVSRRLLVSSSLNLIGRAAARRA